MHFISEKSADVFQDKLIKKLILLENSPYMYQSMEYNNMLRRFFVDKYVIIYRVEKNSIFILRILPQKSNYKKRKLNIIKFKF